jgi:hypothetical protein
LLYVRDSLSNGQSFYLNEVRRIKDLTSLLETTPRVFALLDEPFKGTNVHDATEATALLLDGLCAQVASTVILATHLSEVVRSRSDDPCLVTGYLVPRKASQAWRSTTSCVRACRTNDSAWFSWSAKALPRHWRPPWNAGRGDSAHEQVLIRSIQVPESITDATLLARVPNGGNHYSETRAHQWNDRLLPCGPAR